MQNINPIITPPHCPACGTQMGLREKDGSKFWGCPHYKECGSKTVPYGEPKKFTPRPTLRGLTEQSKTLDNWIVLQNSLETIINQNKVIQETVDEIARQFLNKTATDYPKEHIDVRDIPFN